MTTQTENHSKQPTHTAYSVKAKDRTDKADWIKVGAAWEHGDHSGFNLVLNILGQDVTVTVRKNKQIAN